jgi:exopolysaccharide biosynthesis WecB/TagA/CpsF family protein
MLNVTNFDHDFVRIFELNFFDVTIESMVESIIDGSCENKIVVTPNVDHVIRYHKDNEFRKIYSSSDIFLNDSRILRLMSKFTRNRLESLVPGSDLTAVIFDKISGENNIKIAVIGGSKEIISTIEEKYSISKIVHYNPPMGFHTDNNEMKKCVDVCKAAAADIVFLAVGSPKQEMVAKQLKEANVSGCYLCIGASLLFLAGEEKRAPEFVRKVNCEWLYRLLQNPKRLAKRYLIDGWGILPILIKEISK